ncbi:AcrR family transcriptional regulator [Streptosporangium becharense]|uniref:AcrR family transcriptional regulator n=1 Tax=Streptosporangium becharense TaxID=1816182 RepID=A0A7W9INX9_9ACTN|nr:TetR/AcrR family transcriptional regulator [Streptosporangium becharense]MBB2914370.1 AcrR family transcriptional regulator [Streptosporangium becharense]MBB5823598.1 AcrR family transcriptional regulator [Streptosporangium becharense]
MTKAGRQTLTERRTEELRMTIARRAAEIFVADGDTSATVERIADAAGIATRTFYRHFPVKEDVVRPLFRRSSQLVIEALREAPAGGDLVDVLVTVWMSALGEDTLGPSERRLLAVVASSPQYRLRWMEADDELCEAMAEFLAGRIGRGGRPLERSLPAYLVVQATRHVFMQWITSDTGRDVAELLREAFRMVLDGVRTAAAARTPPG